MKTTAITINPSLSPPFCSKATTPPSCSSSSSSFPPSFPRFHLSGAKPISLSCRGTRLCFLKGSKTLWGRKSFVLGAGNMTMAEVDSHEEGENEGALVGSENENNSRPRRIALFVEPSPFAYVSGYKNRFQNFIRCLREMGDEVMVVTTHEGVPQEFYGAKLIGSWRFLELLSLQNFCVFLLSCPIIPMYQFSRYIPRYTFSWLVKPMWLIIKFLHRAADLTLVPSAAIAGDLLAARVTAANKIRLWNKGVDSEKFHPKYRSHEMRLRLSNDEPDKPLIIHVGRLGVEKSLDFLKRLMDRLPDARIAFVGDGPYREELEKMFEGMPAVFTGMLGGEELSQAYASGDVFVMPSESETLGFVVLEAMSSGIPVVAARAGGIPDIIPADQDGKTSYLYDPRDLEDCLSKLRPLLHNKELRETMGKAAREEMEKYDWKAATRKIRNEQYNAAIWFWRKKRAQLLRPFQRLAKRFFPSPQVNYR
ncbi:Sulfoquinovosyl transferase SQD2 isoform B [Glycine soja]|uniref:Sulfoquinovosyl transferase SQD2 isoform B n=1 Tax=Glycine soja TaxID=3848 RepID=A0A445FVK2_GLYSO|nr:Sulfoquinovosyl transferase SQD2 isoform B [Glycine soja]